MTNDRAVIETHPSRRACGSAEASRRSAGTCCLFPAEAEAVARRRAAAPARASPRSGTSPGSVSASSGAGRADPARAPRGADVAAGHRRQHDPLPRYRAAAVAPAADVGGLGIDAEIHEPLPDGVGRLVASADEQAHLDEVAQHRSHIHWDRLLFGAKECVYKVWSPRTGEWLDFLDASITFDPDAGSFAARLLVPGPFVDLRRRFLVEDGLAVTSPGSPASR